MVCLGEGNSSDTVSKLNKMLSVLLSESLSPKQKEDTLAGEFEFTTINEREELLNDMCIGGRKESYQKWLAIGNHLEVLISADR